MGKRALSKSSIGTSALTPLPVEQVGIDPVQPHGIAAPHEGVALRVRVKQVQHATLADHRIVVDVLLEPLPELERLLVERDVARFLVVRPHDRGVAPDIAAAEPALLDHRDVGQPMVLGQVIGGGEPVPAATDDHGVVGPFRLWLAPHGCPAGLALEGLREDGQNRIMHDGVRPRDAAAHPSTPDLPSRSTRVEAKRLFRALTLGDVARRVSPNRPVSA